MAHWAENFVYRATETQTGKELDDKFDHQWWVWPSTVLKFASTSHVANSNDEKSENEKPKKFCQQKRALWNILTTFFLHSNLKTSVTCDWKGNLRWQFGWCKIRQWESKKGLLAKKAFWNILTTFFCTAKYYLAHSLLELFTSVRISLFTHSLSLHRWREDKVLCPLCNKHYKYLTAHLKTTHGKTGDKAKGISIKELSKKLPQSCPVQGCEKMVVRVDLHLRRIHRLNKDNPEYLR